MVSLHRGQLKALRWSGILDSSIFNLTLQYGHLIDNILPTNLYNINLSSTCISACLLLRVQKYEY